MDDYVALSLAVDAIGQCRRRASVPTILSAIVGLANTGCTVRAGDKYCDVPVWFRSATFDEWAQPLEDGRSPIVMERDYNMSFPPGFWTADMVAALAKDDAFRAGNLSRAQELHYSQLPYRMVKSGSNSTARYRLIQEARGIHLHWDAVELIVAEPDWSPWRNSFAAKRRGPAPTYAWDAMKARLTVEAANRPELIDGDLAAIVGALKWVWDELASESEVNDFPLPDEPDLYRYARKLAVARQRVEARSAVAEADIAPSD